MAEDNQRSILEITKPLKSILLRSSSMFLLLHLIDLSI